MLNNLGQSVEDSCMRHKPQELTSCGNVTVIYDMSIFTEWHVLHIKRDLNIWNKEGRTGVIFDTTVPRDRNFLKKYA